ncbi:MAG: hypothetical protein KAQ64_01380 [Candidatus Pacebacteria bacterium]|nr:hypothetical protein [Candidatus Paceibacterota bacterium]
MNNKIAVFIIAVAIALIIGFVSGSEYQKINNPNEKENVEKVNAIYSIVYVSDIEEETIGINIISIESPTKHLKKSVLLNKYDILEYIDRENNRALILAFEGYNPDGKPIIKYIKGGQEALDYEGQIINTFNYQPQKINRITGE